MAAKVSGLVQVADDVYLTEPTRRHSVLVIREDDRWIAWAGRWDKHSGETPGREWTLYRGTSLESALREATRFAGRFRHGAVS